MAAVSTSTLYLTLRARDEASKVIRGLSTSLTEADAVAAKATANAIRRGQSFATIGVATAGAGLLGVAALNKMSDAAIAYNQQVALTSTQVDKVIVSTQQLSKMGTDLAKTFPVAFDQIQPTLYDIFSSIDVNAPQAAKLLAAIATSAVAGSADMQTVGRATIAILNAYKIPVEDVTKVSDIMFQLVRKGVGTYQEFTDVIGRVVPAGQKAGQTLQTITGMMAFMTRNGLSAAASVAPVTQALNGLSKPAVVKTLHDMGVEIIDATGKFRPMVDIVKDLKAKLDPLPSAIQALDLSKILKGGGNSQASMKFWVDALKDTNGLLPEMVSAMNNAGGATAAAYKIMSDTPAAKIQDMKNNFHNLEIAVGNAVIPIKKDFAQALADIFGWFDKLSPGWQQTITYVFAAGAGLLVLVGIITAASGAWMLFSKAMAGLQTVESISIVTTAMKGFGETVVLQGMYIGETISTIVAEYAAMTLVWIADAARQVAAWIDVTIATRLAAVGAEDSVAAQIAAWLALKIAAIADATEIAAAWLLATGPVGVVAAIVAGAVAVVGGSFLILKDELNNNKKQWYDWAAIFSAGGVVGVVLEKVFGKKAVAPYDAVSTYKPNWGPTRPLTNGGAPDLTSAGQMAKDQADLKKQVDDFQKQLQALLNPTKKPGASDSPIVSAVQQSINTLKSIIKTGAADISKMAKDVPAQADILQKAIDKLSAYTPNQLKAMGVNQVQKLIDGLKSKEADLTSAYDDVLFKTALAAYNKSQALASQGADAINAFIAKMTGDLGKDATTLKPITLTLGSDVVDAFATGMAQADPKARMQAYTTLVGSVETAYQGVLTQLEAVRQAVIDKMKVISDAISQGIMSVVSFSTAYTKAMDIAKAASQVLADQNKAKLDEIDKDYQTGLAKLDATLKSAQNDLTQTASNISGAIISAMDFSSAASEANKYENTFMDQLVIQAQKAKDFGDQIKTLIKMGLSGAAINEVAQAGVDAGATIAQNIIDGGAAAVSQTNDLVKSVTDLADSLGTTTADTYYQAGVTQAQAQYDGYVATMGPNSPGYLAMVKAGDDAVTAMASTMGETFQQALAAQGNIASGFADQLNQLVAMGLSPEAIQQVVAAGADAGSAIAASLIKGGATAIKQTNDILSATQTMADKVGTDAASHYYSAGLANADAMIQAFTDYFGPKGAGRAALMSAMDDLANSMNRTATVTINTVNPGLMPNGSSTPGSNNLVPNTGSPNDNPKNNDITGTQGVLDIVAPGQSTQAPQIVVQAPITTVSSDPQQWAASMGYYLAGILKS